MWNYVYLFSLHTEQDKTRSFLANQVVKSLLEVEFKCPHLSQRSLWCKSALALLHPLKYGWCSRWDCIWRALKWLYGDDKTHTTACVWLLMRRPERATAVGMTEHGVWSEQVNGQTFNSLGENESGGIQTSVNDKRSHYTETILRHGAFNPQMRGGWRLLLNGAASNDHKLSKIRVDNNKLSFVRCI